MNAAGLLMNQHPKIWKTEDEILAAIDSAHRYAERKREAANELEEELKVKRGHLEELRFELMKMPSSNQRTSLENRIANVELSVGKLKEDLSKLAKSYHRTIDKRLPRLGEILAAFRTGTFKEVVGEYRGVAVK